MQCLPSEYLDSICEIKTMSNSLIGTGYIRALKDEYLEVSNRTDKMALLRPNTVIKINVLNEKLGLKIIVGTVYISNEQFMRIVDAESIANFEKRNFFRIRLDLFAKGFLAPELVDKAHGETGELDFFILDLSLGGVLVTTAREMKRDETFNLVLPLEEPQLVCCRVVRIQESPGGTPEYGCEFTETSARQLDLLCQFVFAKQREQIQKLRERDAE